MSLTFNLSSADVPENLECVITKEKWQQLIALLSVILPEGFQMNIGNTTPAPEDRVWPWLRLDVNGKIDRLYHYAMGFWLSKYHTPANSPIRLPWTGSPTDLLTYDEGENTAVSEITGPFWEVDTNFEQRIPIGVGTLPTSGDPVAVNTNYGADEYTIQNANIRRHRHHAAANTSTSGAGLPSSGTQISGSGGGAAQENYDLQGTNTAATIGLTSFVQGQSQTDDNEAFSILNPVRGVYFIKRTARLYWRLAA